MSKPATHTGVTYTSNYGLGGTTRPVELREGKIHWIDADTGAKYEKRTGAVRPYNAWSRTTLTISSIKPKESKQ
jgi:hypothetical protein